MDAEYYNKYESQPEGCPRRSWLMWLLDMILVVVSAVVSLTMVTTYVVPFVNPSWLWFLPVLGLAAPAIYLLTIILTLYWIIRSRWIFAGVMLVIVVLGIPRVSLFWRPEFRRGYGVETYDKNAFKVMTYNIRSFYNEKGKSSVRDVLNLIREQDPDVVCLQEFNARLSERNEEFAQLDDTYERAVFGRTQNPSHINEAPLLILSKYRILHSGVVLAPSVSVWADLLMGDDTVRVFNNHLRSTAIKAADNEYITNRGFLSDTAREVKIRSIVDRLRDNSVLRAGQVDSLAQVISNTHTRRIVCGDFNDTPMSYVYRTMAKGLNDAFSERGSGYSHTFRGFFNTLRIDYLLCSEGFEVLSYEVLPVEFSDHHPVVVRLRKNTINN